MTTTIANGRLGNQIIRNLAVSLIAEKYDLKVDYVNRDYIAMLGIDVYSGKNVYPETRALTDENYMSVRESGKVDYNLDPNQSYFQTREIMDLIYQHLHSDKIRSKIIAMNPFRERYNANNDLFIHIRLTDVSHLNPGLLYYLRAISQITFDDLFISTDDGCHPIIRDICEKYPRANVIQCGEITTFQFASTCRHILLSHGSFSALIGYLAFFSTVYYPKYDVAAHHWHGDMFSVKGWIAK